MTISFSVRSDSTITVKPAVVTARQLAAFRSFAREHGHLVGVRDDPASGYLAYGFEARVCPWNRASIARIFDDCEAVISVVEEAQFLGLNVRFWIDSETASIMMAVSPTPDNTRAMDLSNASAHALLQALGIGNEPSGDLDLSVLTDFIADPATRRQLERHGMEPYPEQLDRMVTAPGDDSKRLVWA